LEVETVGVMFWDLADGTLVDANNTFLKLMGYTRRDLEERSLTWQKLTPPEYFELSDAEFRKVQARGRVGPYEKEYLHKDGTRQWFVFAGSSLGDNSCVEFCVDISDRKRAEAALRESQECLQAMANGIPQLVWMAKPDGHIFWYNQRWYEYTGTTLEQMQGWGWHSVHDPDVLPIVVERWKDSLAKVQPFEMEFPLRGVDGSYRMFLTRVVPWKDGQGAVLGWFGTNTDITEQKQSQAQLAAQAEELTRQAAELYRSREALAAQGRTLQSVLDNIGDGLIATDAHGKFLLWNPAADRILGQGMADVPPAKWAEHYRIFLPDRTTPFPAEELPLARALRGRQADSEMFIRTASGESGAWVEASAQPICDKGGSICGGVVAFRDITRRVLADRAIRDLNAKLEQRVFERTAELLVANKEMEAFSYSISHDLRAPLRHISGFVRMLREDFSSQIEPEAQRYIKNIEDGALNMSRMVDEMLNLSRLGRQALHCEPTGLNQLIDEVVSLLQPDTAGRQIAWKIAALTPVECDATLIKQVFQNLISNALKYSRKREQAVIEIGESERDGAIAIFVRDNGDGFDMKYADKLFGVFQRLHRAEEFEGTGVGLATVARIVQKHGGRVWAEAEKDRGATFFFTLGKSASVGRRSPTAAAAGSVPG
jgi:PAS domain S-box-containing protein